MDDTVSFAVQMLAQRPLSDGDKKRFSSKVQRHSSGCWLWMGCKWKSGYGCFSVRGIGYLAHRISKQIQTGEIVPAEQQVNHTCNVRACVNPDHLYIGSHLDNMLDKVSDGTNGRKLTAIQVREIRRRYTGRHGEQTELAREYGVSSVALRAVVRGLTWKRGNI